MLLQAFEEAEQYRVIGTVEEFKALKENQCKCEDCAGCTVWKCDCANIRQQAIDEFANVLKENYDYLPQILSQEAFGLYIDEYAEQLKAGVKE